MSDSELLNRLKELGLHLTSEGLQVCKDEIKQTQLVSTTATESKLTAQDVFNHAANRSLKGIGAKCLDEKRSTDVLSGLRLLQVVSVRNLSAPEVRQESSAFPRMLDLVLFDGHVRCHAIEHVPVPLLKESALPPGVKILLKDARVFQGVILLEPKSVVKTCGAVDRLAESWKIKQSIEANRSFLQQLQPGEQPPPPFVPFAAQKPKEERKHHQPTTSLPVPVSTSTEQPKTQQPADSDRDRQQSQPQRQRSKPQNNRSKPDRREHVEVALESDRVASSNTNTAQPQSSSSSTPASASVPVQQQPAATVNSTAQSSASSSASQTPSSSSNSSSAGAGRGQRGRGQGQGRRGRGAKQAWVKKDA